MTGLGVFYNFVDFVIIFYVEYWVITMVRNRFLEFLIDIGVIYLVLNFWYFKFFEKIMLVMGVLGEILKRYIFNYYIVRWEKVFEI